VRLQKDEPDIQVSQLATCIFRRYFDFPERTTRAAHHVEAFARCRFHYSVRYTTKTYDFVAFHSEMDVFVVARDATTRRGLALRTRSIEARGRFTGWSRATGRHLVQS
jgi:hypothetical protein